MGFLFLMDRDVLMILFFRKKLQSFITLFFDVVVDPHEVHVVFISICSFKALGKDGFQPIFFKTYQDEVGDDVWNHVHKAFENGNFDKNIAETLVVLIPKKERPTNFKNFHQISLYSVIYKLITKDLVSKLCPYL